MSNQPNQPSQIVAIVAGMIGDSQFQLVRHGRITGFHRDEYGEDKIKIPEMVKVIGPTGSLVATFNGESPLAVVGQLADLATLATAVLNRDRETIRSVAGKMAEEA